jgi:hypothetical protein
MSNEVTTENAGSEIKTVEKSNITVAELAARRLGTPKVPVEAPKAIKDNQPEPEKEPKVGPEQPKEKDVLSKFDLGEMSDVELRELSDKLGSRAVARFGELTAKRKQAEEQIAALQSELNKRNQESPLEVKSVEKNPYAALDTVESLQAKASEVTDVIEWAEDKLDQADHLAHDDIVTTVDGRDMTKADIKAALKNARKAKDKFLPAQLQELQARENRSQLKKSFDEHARKELDWLNGEDNDTRKQYEAMLGDKRLTKLLEADPDIAPQLPYILAHAANSMYGRKSIPLTDAKPKITPPSSPTSSTGSSEKPEARSSKAISETVKRFSSTGSVSDYAAMRALQLSKRS